MIYSLSLFSDRPRDRQDRREPEKYLCRHGRVQLYLTPSRTSDALDQVARARDSVKKAIDRPMGASLGDQTAPKEGRKKKNHGSLQHHAARQPSTVQSS